MIICIQGVQLKIILLIKMAKEQKDVCHMYGVKLGEQTWNQINNILSANEYSLEIDKTVYVATNHINQCQGLLPGVKKGPVEFIGETIVILGKNKVVLVGTFSGKRNGVILLNNKNERRQGVKDRAFKLTAKRKKKNRVEPQKNEKIIELGQVGRMKIPFWPR